MSQTLTTLTLTTRNRTFTQNVTPTTTLDDILLFFDVQDASAFQAAALQRQDYERTQFLSYVGKPENEDFGPGGTTVISIQYNVPGLMQPHLTFDNGTVYQANKVDFGKITLGQIYVQDGGDNSEEKKEDEPDGQNGPQFSATTLPTSIKVTLTHVYTTDHISKQQQQDAIAQVMKSFNTNGGAQPQQQQQQQQRQQQAHSESELAQLCEINTMLGELESKYPFAKPKVIVSVRVQAPPQPKVEQDGGEKKAVVQSGDDSIDSSVPSDEECSDSDDDRFYKHTKKDYKVIHKQYIKNRQELKKEMEKQRQAGQTPICTVPDTSSDEEDEPIVKPSGAVTAPVKVVGGNTKPKSLAEMAREMKANRTATQPTTRKNSPQPQPPKPAAPVGLGNVFKTKDGKFAPASLTYRFRLPTIFFPLPLPPNADVMAVPTKVVINISFEVDVPSTMTVDRLYALIQTLIASPITTYITERMGAAPVSGQMIGNGAGDVGVDKTKGNVGSGLDNYPFTISLAAPPSTILTSQFVNKDKKRFPLGGETTMRNLNIGHRSAFFVHFRHIHPTAQPLQNDLQSPPSQKNPVDLIQFLTEQGGVDAGKLNEGVVADKNVIETMLKSILSADIDQFIVS